MALVSGRMMQHQRLLRQRGSPVQVSSPARDQRLHDEVVCRAGIELDLAVHGKRLRANPRSLLQVTGGKQESTQVAKRHPYRPSLAECSEQRDALLVAGTRPLKVTQVPEGHGQVVERKGGNPSVTRCLQDVQALLERRNGLG